MKCLNLLLGVLLFFSCRNATSIDLNKEMAHVDSLDSARKSEVQSDSNGHNDSLMKYTYPMEQRYGGEHIGHGSCWFYKKGNESCAVTNMHIFTGINYWGSSPREQVDTNIVRFDVNDSLIIPVSKYAKEYATDIYYVAKGGRDIFKVPFKTTNRNRKVRFINDLIDTAFFDKIPVKIFCYGYGGDMFDVDSPDWLHAKPISTSGNYLSFDDWIKKYFRPNEQDAAKYQYRFMKDNYFFIKSPTATGMSGSPVFGSFPVLNGQNFVVKFIGIICAGEARANAHWVLKARYVYNYLQNKH